MYLPTAVAFAMLPFLVGAFPIKNSRSGLSHIPLSKPSIRDANGHVDVESLQANINHTMAFVFPVFFFWEDWILNGVST